MKKIYKEPRIRVVDMATDSNLLALSDNLDYADVKEKTDWDDDAWAEEVQTTEAKNPNLWDKEW